MFKQLAVLLYFYYAHLGYQVVQVACLVHCDLHDDYTLKAVNFLASSVVSLSQSENSGAEKKAEFAINITDFRALLLI